MDSSITENYLDYNSDQFDSWLEDFDSKIETLQSDVYSEESETETIVKSRKKNNIFMRSKSKTKVVPEKVDTMYYSNDSESVVKPVIKPIKKKKIHKRRSRKIEPIIEKPKQIVKPKPKSRITVTGSQNLLLLRRNRMIRRNKAEKVEMKTEVRKNKLLKKRIGWEKITLNDINQIIPEL